MSQREPDPRNGAGALLRRWRQRRRLSQLELSLRTGISTRHLSFVETGRAAPSRTLILRLTDALDIPHRERNVLLLAGGLAPANPDLDHDSPSLAEAMQSIKGVLRAYDSAPALALDRRWNIVRSNNAANLFLAGVSDHLLKPPVNALRLTLHPDGLAPRILNLAQWRTAALRPLATAAVAYADPDMHALHEELLDYSGDRPSAEIETEHLYIPLTIISPDGISEPLNFLSFTTTFGTAVDVTLSELHIEVFLPADPRTRAYCQDVTWPASG